MSLLPSVAAAWLVLQGGTGSRAAESESDLHKLAIAIQQVQEGDFELARITLEAISERLKRAGRKHDAARAYLYLGVSDLKLGDASRAQTRFREATALEPKLAVPPEQFSPDVVQAFALARAADRKKGGSMKAIVLIAAAGAAAGGGYAVMQRRGETSPPAVPVGPGRIAFLGSVPAPGSTVSLASDQIIATLQVSYSFDIPNAAVTAALKLANGTPCLENFSAASVRANQPVDVRVVLARMASPPAACAPPFTTGLLTASLSQAGRVTILREDNFSVSYRFVP